MKIKQSTREKYDWYRSLCRDDEPQPLPAERAVMVENGLLAIDAFHLQESTGKIAVTREPEELARYRQGKRWHGVTVEQVAEAFAFDRTETSANIKANYPAWVAAEIFSLAKKLAVQRIGFVPAFIAEGCDWSERAVSNEANEEKQMTVKPISPSTGMKQPELPPIIRIPTKRGSIALSTLRPGDWVRGPTNSLFCCLINSKKHRKIVLRSDVDGEEFSHRYEDLRESVAFAGQGAKRLWWPLLPRFLRQSLCPYSSPKPPKTK